jgi:hypothetical protein
MEMKEEFTKLVDKLRMERDEIKLKIHLASMDVKKEFEAAEKQWSHIKIKASEITDGAVEASEDLINKSKIVGDELKETYKRISKRLSE